MLLSTVQSFSANLSICFFHLKCIFIHFLRLFFYSRVVPSQSKTEDNQKCKNTKWRGNKHNTSLWSFNAIRHWNLKFPFLHFPRLWDFFLKNKQTNKKKPAKFWRVVFVLQYIYKQNLWYLFCTKINLPEKFFPMISFHILIQVKMRLLSNLVSLYIITNWDCYNVNMFGRKPYHNNQNKEMQNICWRKML